jgi:hypothetical protein
VTQKEDGGTDILVIGAEHTKQGLMMMMMTTTNSFRAMDGQTPAT